MPYLRKNTLKISTIDVNFLIKNKDRGTA